MKLQMRSVVAAPTQTAVTVIINRRQPLGPLRIGPDPTVESEFDFCELGLPRPSLRPTDRLFWVWLSKIWIGWREALIIVKPETVIAWHRQAFCFYWRWL